MNFKIGDRVRLVHLKISENNGAETIILGTHPNLGWIVDLLPCRVIRKNFPQQMYALVLGKNLEHIYDGNEKAEWDEAIWVPEGVAA